MTHHISTLSLGATLVIACAAWSGGVAAQPPGPMSFSDMDKNGDGSVTAQEFAAAHGEQMAARAAQGTPMRGAANAPSFADFDQNGDGKMTPAEFDAGRQAQMQGRPGMGMGPGMGAGPSKGPGPGN
ncbi:MAG: EF-hand domain-containing protein [Azonexus sp.]